MVRATSALGTAGPSLRPSRVRSSADPPMVIWYHSSPFLSTPRMPMCPTWWCPQALIQPGDLDLQRRR